MQSEQDYQNWMKSFYRGSFLVKGWDDRKREILGAISEKKEETGRLLDELGELIAPEWAKDNNIRKIDNNDLLRWGNLLKQASLRSADAVIAAIAEMKEQARERIT